MSKYFAVKEKVQVPSSSSKEYLPLIVQSREMQIIEREGRLVSRHPSKSDKVFKGKVLKHLTQAHTKTTASTEASKPFVYKINKTTLSRGTEKEVKSEVQFSPQ
eukprot:Ihof_evm5s487 gene=Ihof_evmTU5s487